jgi:phage gpG-like protein
MYEKNFTEFGKDIAKISSAVKLYLTKDAPRIVGIEATNHFKRSFNDGGFTNTNLIAWKRSKRTDSGSIWYGFEYGAKSPVPDKHPRRWRAKSAYKARKPNAITNFSPAATKRNTLTGSSTALRDSIRYQVNPGVTVVSSNMPYARIHNEGGTCSVFGRGRAEIPKRQFIGHSTKLNEKLKQRILNDISKLIKKQ